MYRIEFVYRNTLHDITVNELDLPNYISYLIGHDFLLIAVDFCPHIHGFAPNLWDAGIDFKTFKSLYPTEV